LAEVLYLFCISKNAADSDDGVPITSGGKDAEMLFDDGIGVKDAVGSAPPAMA